MAPTVVEAVPVALAMPAVPMIRPIIGTNTYRQVLITDNFKKKKTNILHCIFLYAGVSGVLKTNCENAFA